MCPATQAPKDLNPRECWDVDESEAEKRILPHECDRGSGSRKVVVKGMIGGCTLGAGTHDQEVQPSRPNEAGF